MLPLENIKILDLSSGLTCNLAMMYLTSFGAKVTKLEKPGEGDRVRQWEPQKNGKSIYFHYLNSGKKSLTLDIEKEEGREILKELLPYYDVVCVNFAPEQLETMGLDYESLKSIKPDVIYASCTPFGLKGPLKNKPASSLVVQALGVAMDMTGVINEYPVSSAPSITEHYAAGYLATGIVLAAIDKTQRGIGQIVDISLQDAIFSCIEAAPAAWSTVEELHTRKGNFDPSCAPYDTFQTCDGYVAVGCATQLQWEKFCDVLKFDDLKRDARFKDNEGRRFDYLNILRPLVAERILKMEKLVVESKCRDQGIPCCAVLNIQEITDMPNTIENGFMVKEDTEDMGEIHFPALPFVLSDTSSVIHTHAPELGENTEEILKFIGMTEKEILYERERKVI